MEPREHGGDGAFSYLYNMKTIGIDFSHSGVAGEILYSSVDISIFLSVGNLSFLPEGSFLLDGMVVALVQNGHAVIDVGDNAHALNKGDIFVASPRNIINHLMVSMDFEVTGCFASTAFFDKMAHELHYDLTSLLIGHAYSFRSIDEADQELFVRYIGIIAALLRRTSSQAHEPGRQTPGNDKSLLSMFQSFGVFLENTLKDKLETNGVKPYARNSAENRINQFLTLLSNQHAKFCTLNEYADQLSISPKYFSNICKKVTGKTVGELVTERIIVETKILLSDPALSIKQISDILGFANPSHFGTFIRRHTGMSPQSLRASL